MSNTENLRPISSQERHANLKAYYDAAFAQGRNSRVFPEYTPETTHQALDAYTIFMNEGWVGIENTRQLESHVQDSWFSKE